MSRPVPSTEAVEALHGFAEPLAPLDAPATFTSDCSLIRALTNQWTHSDPRASMLSTTYGRPLAALLCGTLREARLRSSTDGQAPRARQALWDARSGAASPSACGRPAEEEAGLTASAA